MNRRGFVLGIGVLIAAGGALFLNSDRLRPLWVPYWRRFRGRRTVEQVMAAEGARGLARLKTPLNQAGFGETSPARLRFIGLKAEKRLEMWGSDGAGFWRKIKDYPVLALSGGPGPKLREGDRQAPEGIYRLTFLNANSAFHLSIRIGYPSEADRAQAAEDGRTQLGGDIMIHGRAASIGCFAIGDPAIEEVFALTAQTGLANSEILIAPNDLRLRAASDPRPWVAARYAEMSAILRRDHAG